MQQSPVWGTGFTAWHSDIGAVVKDEIGADEWMQYCNKADQLYGHVGGLKKNSLHIGASLAFAFEDGKRSESLEKLCTNILEPENFIPFS